MIVTQTCANLIIGLKYRIHYAAERMHSITGKRALKRRAACTKLSVFTDLPLKEWFEILSDLKKIKILRFTALSYKSIGNRKKYEILLEDTLKNYGDNPYAKFIYWANKAAPFYVLAPNIAWEYLQKCEFENFSQNYSDEIELLLWVSNDLGIVNFYKENLEEASRITRKVLQKSKQLNNLENMARSYNLLGAIELKNNQLKEAQTEFYNALTFSLHEKSEAFFHFAINYITTLGQIESTITNLVMEYIKVNKQRLLKIFQTEELKSCRWYVSVCAFNKYLSKYIPIMQKELENIFGTDILLNPSSYLQNYIIKDYPIVLF